MKTIKMPLLRKTLSLLVILTMLTGIFASTNCFAVKIVSGSPITEADKVKLENEVNVILSNIRPEMSNIEKVKVVNEYFYKNIKYDEKDYLAGKISFRTHTIYGALVDKNTVCSGYATAFNLIMDRLGIPSTVVISISMDHCWNMVQLNGSWYHIDTTWNRHNLYENFLKSDAVIAKSGHGMTKKGHYGWGDDAPKATSTKFDNFDWNNATPETINQGITVTTATVQLDTSDYTGKVGKSYCFLAKSNIGETTSAASYNGYIAKVTPVSSSAKGDLYKIEFLKPGSAVIKVRSASGATASISVTVS
jgi:hypothetical protein